MIVTHFICEDCESEMVRTEAEDVKYNFLLAG
ncbi:sigma factor G inhibitor Gin [Paenibacillus rhizoplanae]